MPLSIIAAMSENGVIGCHNQLPWHLPNDLQYFRQRTMGHWIIMGRKTFESIGKPLPGRRNIVLTHNKNFNVQNCMVAYSLDMALSISSVSENEEVFIIGGASVYRAALPICDRIDLTIVHTNLEGDAFFPPLDKRKWELVDCSDYDPDQRHRYSYSMVHLERVSRHRLSLNRDARPRGQWTDRAPNYLYR